MEQSNRTIHSIQSLRGIAAIAVMLLHYNEFISISHDSIFGKILPGAAWGVDLFFIISGFVASYTIKNDATGFKYGSSYLIKRFIRIAPLYYILTILSFGSDKTAWINSVKSILFIPIGGDFGPAYGGAQIGQGWTLNYEMFFYLIISISFAFGKLKWLFLTSFLFLIIGIAFILSPRNINFLIYGPSFTISYLSMATHPIILEFVSGVFLGLYYPKMSNNLTPQQIILCAIGITIFIYNAMVQKWVGHGLQGWGFPSFLILLSLLKLEKCGYSFKTKTLSILGAYSYSIYLLHENIKNIFIKTSKHIYTMNGCTLLILSLITTLILSSITYKLIEVELSNWIKRKIFS